MDNLLINNRFRSIIYIIIHFSCSLIQLACVFSILGLQITLTITETCAFRIAVGYWSFPFLLFSPISIWLFVWKRNSFFCFITFIIHICSTLFATIVIIISFLVLIQQIGTSCSISNQYFLSINVSLIAVSILLKIFIYAEIYLLYLLKYKTNDPSVLTEKDIHEKNYQITKNKTNTKLSSPFKSIINRNQNNIKDLDI